MKNLKFWRRHAALRYLPYLRVPGFSRWLPEYQYSAFFGLLVAFLHYHFAPSPWYVDLLVFWYAPQLVLGIIILCQLLKKQPREEA